MCHFPSNPKAKVKHDLDICEIETRLCLHIAKELNCSGSQLCLKFALQLLISYYECGPLFSSVRCTRCVYVFFHLFVLSPAKYLCKKARFCDHSRNHHGWCRSGQIGKFLPVFPVFHSKQIGKNY